ncbi:MAG: hypothetical protein ABH860_02400 [bacterium]
MKYHKKLTRKDVAKQGWNRIILMIASELSRADHLSKNGGGAEVETCILRAKELFGVLESEPSLPYNIGRRLLTMLHKITRPSKIQYGKLYNSFMALAS